VVATFLGVDGGINTSMNDTIDLGPKDFVSLAACTGMPWNVSGLLTEGPHLMKIILYNITIIGSKMSKPLQAKSMFHFFSFTPLWIQ
ncbi:hypothetical protein ACJX0J_029009, partial [Zea mays]